MKTKNNKDGILSQSLKIRTHLKAVIMSADIVLMDSIFPNKITINTFATHKTVIQSSNQSKQSFSAWREILSLFKHSSQPVLTPHSSHTDRSGPLCVSFKALGTTLSSLFNVQGSPIDFNTSLQKRQMMRKVHI